MKNCSRLWSYFAQFFLERCFRQNLWRRSKHNNFLFENFAVYEITWKNIVEPGRTQMTIWHIRIACWIPKATNTPSEYVLIIASPQQQWLRERALILRYMYTACLVKIIRLIAT